MSGERAQSAVATASVVLELGSGLFALVHPYELDGRASSHPLHVRGFSSMNCLLLVEDDGAVLFSTGYSVHEQALLEQLEGLVGDRRLTLVIPRVEFPSMCNARPIADRFDVDAVYLRLPSTASPLLNFRPEHSLQDDGLRDVRTAFIQDNCPLAVGSSGRELVFLMPQLRLLPSNWAYDQVSRTLMTGDMFSWVWQESPDGPWLLDDDEHDPTTPERVQDFLLRNRYWWLAGAQTEPLRAALARLFDERDIDVIAPDHGPVLRGEAVGRHLELLDAFLATAQQLPAVGVQVGRWSTSGSTG